MLRFKVSAILVSAFLCSVLQAASYDALVTAVRGNVLELDAQQQVIRTLSVRSTIPEGHAIRTQPGSSVTLVLANGAVLSVQPETTLVLEQMQLDGDASMASYRPLRPSPANTAPACVSNAAKCSVKSKVSAPTRNLKSPPRLAPRASRERNSG
jgi:hypothetical protein